MCKWGKIAQNSGFHRKIRQLSVFGSLSVMNTPQAHSIAIRPIEGDSWQQQLANSPFSAQALLTWLELPVALLPAGEQGAEDFPIRAPMAFLQRIEKGNIHDPLLRQVWPLIEESQTPPSGFVLDPLGESSSNPTPGVVHKYHNRVLLVVNGSCAIHCRYCFRRHFPYDDNRLSRQQWLDTLDYIQKRPEINEVILSGGDPLSSSDKRLFDLIDAIEAIPHVKRLRIHSRLPIVIPARITHALLQRLSNSHLKIIMVVHANHANEIDQEVAIALQTIKQAGIHLLNQSVLLKGVNDDAQSLIHLSERLFECDVLPYYLHLLDPVIGAHHFDVSESSAITIMTEMQKTLPGFLMPKLVREVDGRLSKTSIPIPVSRQN
ncbi:MAG: EF-P beta-lysylation protein EpmB [Bermanella sp.]|jgi:EF-P beta-lysylation protein EpmB